MTDEDIIKEFELTEEYKAWQESFLAVIGYMQDEELHDEDLANDLMADHLNTSLALSNGLEKARYEVRKKLNEEMLGENRDF